MNFPPVVHMERMKEEYRSSVSQLLFQGFRSKFGTRLTYTQLQLLLEWLLMLDEQRGNSQRIVAMQEGSVIGSLSLQFQSRSCVPRPSGTSAGMLPLWKGIQKVGWRKALGFAIRLACLSHRPARGEMYIADVSVHQQFQGLGVGRSMLEWTLHEVMTRPGIQYTSLHVSGSNVRAKQLYERMGFRTLEVQTSLIRTWLLGEQDWHYMIHKG